MQDHIYIGVVRLQRLICRLCLGPAYVGVLVQNLALQVGDVDGVEIDDADGAHACQRQINCDWRAQAARANNQDFGVEKLTLSRASDLGHDDVSAVPLNLVRR